MKVLVPLDGSERSMQAMERGLKLLKTSNPEVTLLCVQSEGMDKVDEDRRAEYENDPDDEIFATDAEANGMLIGAKARCAAIGVPVDTKVVEGKYLELILAQGRKFDLVLMHSLQKEQLLEKLHMGGAEYLVRRLETAVLLA
jgi:nucleotide-binding universal stress UspA family protein